jgi:structural maintenance of chromosomes protein 6
VKTIEQQLEAVQKALKQREARDGASIEEMTIEVNRAKAALEKSHSEHMSLSALTKVCFCFLILKYADS